MWLFYIILQNKQAESLLLLHLDQDAVFQNFVPSSFEGNKKTFLIYELLDSSVLRTNAC